MNKTSAAIYHSGLKDQTQSPKESLYSSVCIIIVDDDTDILDSLKDVIEMENDRYQVTTASSVDEAKQLLSELTPDIALIDIKLGADNGLLLVPEIKAISNDVCCIMMTAFRETEYAVRAVKLGADDYLYKPIDVKYLLKTINQIVDRQAILREKDKMWHRFQAVFQQTNQWAILTDVDGIVLEANQVSLDYLALAATQVEGKSVFESPWWKGKNYNKQLVKESFQQAIAGKIVEDEITLVDNKSKTRHFSIVMLPVRNSKGMIESVLIDCRDITRKKETEKKLVQLTDNLDQLVKERTEQWRQAKEEAERISEAKSQFLSRVSHELRTPLNSVIGFSTLLTMKNTLDDENQEFVNEIREAGERLMHLINDILDVNKLSLEEIQFPKTRVSIDDVLMVCFGLVKSFAESSKVELESEVKAVYLNSNEKALRQIFLNLLENAIKYNRPGGAVKVFSEVNESNQRIIHISDTGNGIEGKNFGRIFEPFERLGQEFHSRGTGTGLVVVKTLADKLGIIIDVDSQMEQGSTFSLIFNAQDSNV